MACKALRLYGAGPSLLERVVPTTTPLYIAGIFIPPGRFNPLSLDDSGADLFWWQVASSQHNLVFTTEARCILWCRLVFTWAMAQWNGGNEGIYATIWQWLQNMRRDEFCSHYTENRLVLYCITLPKWNPLLPLSLGDNYSQLWYRCSWRDNTFFYGGAHGFCQYLAGWLAISLTPPYQVLFPAGRQVKLVFQSREI